MHRVADDKFFRPNYCQNLETSGHRNNVGFWLYPESQVGNATPKGRWGSKMHQTLQHELFSWIWLTKQCFVGVFLRQHVYVWNKETLMVIL